MMNTLSRRNLLGCSIAAGGLALLPRSAWSQLSEGASDYPETRRFLEAFVSQRKLPGTLALIGKNQSPATMLAFGNLAMDNATPVNADSLWRLYSMTKPITGIAAMILMDDGVLGMDQPVADFLPAYAKMKVQNTPDGALNDVRDSNTVMTIRHLLTHTAGLGYNFIQKGPLKTAYERAGLMGGAISRIPIPGLTGGPWPADLAEFADRLATMPLVYELGTQWSYSLSLDVLGRVIEVASGKSFDRFLQDRIFTPLAMQSSYFQVPRAEVRRLTTNYSPLGSFLLPVDPGAGSVFLDPPKVLLGGGGLVGSAADYDRFLAMLIGEGAIGKARILRPETARLAMSNLIDDSVKRAGTFINGAGFGAGGRVSLPSSPEGEGVFGWSGAAGTIGFVDRKRGYRAAAYAQYVPADRLDFQSKFPEVLLKDISQ